MPVQVKVTGDPRRTDEAVPFERPKGEDAGDIMLVVAVVIGAASLLFKWQLGGWAALICTLQAIANMKTKAWDIKQVISAMTFAALGIAGTYLYVPPKAPKPPKTA